MAWSLDTRQRMSEAVLRIRGSNADHFWAKVEKGAPDACWRWLGAQWNNGYGLWKIGSRVDASRRSIQAHRYALILTLGSVPDDLQVDHICHNADLSCRGGASCPHRMCVNPAHLEAVSRSVNLKRGRSRNREKVTCKAGHPLSGTNLYLSQGRRRCRTCQLRWKHDYRQRLRDAGRPVL